MKIISQRHNLFLSPLHRGKKIIWEQTCYCLILHSAPPRAPCHLRRRVWEAEGQASGQGCLPPMSSEKPALASFWFYRPCSHGVWVECMDLHCLPWKHQCAAWVVSSSLPQGLTWLQTWGPCETGRRDGKVLDVEWGWEISRHRNGFPCPSWAVQPSATLDITFHFEDSPSETLQTETSIASQVLLCFCVGFQPWTTDRGND